MLAELGLALLLKVLLALPSLSLRRPRKKRRPIPVGASAQRALAHLRRRAASSVSDEGPTSVGAPSVLLGKRAPRSDRRSGGNKVGSRTKRPMEWERSLCTERHEGGSESSAFGRSMRGGCPAC